MKKSFFNTLPSTKHVTGSMLVAVIAMAGALTSCSDTDGLVAPGEGDGVASMEVSPLKVTNDQDYLSQYVTNYKSGARSRAVGENDEVYSMPVSAPAIPEKAVELKDVNFYWFASDADREAAKTLKVTVPSTTSNNNINVLGDMDIYVASELTIKGASAAGGAGRVNIYVLDGGSLVFDGEKGYSFKVDDSSLVIYNFGEIKSKSTGDTKPCNIEGVTIHTATPFTIDNVGIGTGSQLYAYDGIDVKKLNVYVGALAYSSCKIVASEEIIIDSSSKLSTGYVKAPVITLQGNTNPQMLVLRNGGMWESDKILLNNVENIVVGSNPDSYSCIKAGEIVVNNIDYLTSAFVNTNIVCTKWSGDGRISDISELSFDSSVTLNDTSDIVIDESDASACAPKFVKPAETPETPETPEDPADPTPKPSPLEVISKVQMDDHKHSISATGIDVYGNQAFVSWHERGNNIKGCIEVLNISSPDKVTFEAWMETSEYKAGGALLSDNAYDFNHIVYDQRTNSILTVGDHSKKGGFVAMIDLNKALGLGLGVDKNIDALIPRQIPFAASGNCVARYGENLYIAGAGGFSIFPFGNGEKFPIDKTNNNDYTHLSQCDSLKTQGSAKHLAINGSTVATIEYTDKGADKLPARISLWGAEKWINGDPTTSWTVENFGPTNGKDVIALDDTYVYSCQGTNGMAVYDLTGKEVARFQVNDYLTKDNGFTDADRNKMRNSAANGLCVYGNYVFVANGGAGLWVLDKKNGFKPVAHFTDADSYFTLENEETEKIGASCNYVRVTDSGYVYVAYGLGGVMVLKFDASKI